MVPMNESREWWDPQDGHGRANEWDVRSARVRDVRQNPEWRYVTEGPEWRGRRVTPLVNPGERRRWVSPPL